MDKNTAEYIINAAISLDKDLDNIKKILLSIENKEEQEILLNHLSEVGRHLFLGIMFHIFRQYPDLDPDQDLNRPPAL